MRDISAGVMAVECGSSPAWNLLRPETAAYMPTGRFFGYLRCFLAHYFA